MKLIINFDDSDERSINKFSKKLLKLRKYNRFNPNHKNGLFIYNAVTLNGSTSLIKFLLNNFSFNKYKLHYKETLNFLIKNDNVHLFKVFLHHEYDKLPLILAGSDDRNIFHDIIKNNSYNIYNEFLSIQSYGLRNIINYIIKASIKYNRFDYFMNLYNVVEDKYYDIDDHIIISSCVLNNNVDFYQLYINNVAKYNTNVLKDRATRHIIDNKFEFFKIIINKLVERSDYNDVFMRLFKTTLDHDLFLFSDYLLQYLNYDDLHYSYKNELSNRVGRKLQLILFHNENYKHKDFIKMILKYKILYNNIDKKLIDKIKPNYKPKKIIRSLN